MRIASCSVEGTPCLGVLTEHGFVDLGRRMDGVRDLADLVAPDRLAEAARVARGARPDHAVEELRWEPTVPVSGRIFCIGVNYGGRRDEYPDDTPETSYPSVFVRFVSSLVGHEQALVRPAESVQLDYEGEIVAIIGRGGRRIAEPDAKHHLAGLSVGNDGTVRDWVRHGRFNVTQGKNWDASGSAGPWLTTLDEVGDLDDLQVSTRVNGELRQQDTTASMAFPIAYQVAYLSTFCTLVPGDAIFTGTPTGAGARLDPPRFLAPGDTVEVTVSRVGTLRNGVRDEGEEDHGVPVAVGDEAVSR